MVMLLMSHPIPESLKIFYQLPVQVTYQVLQWKYQTKHENTHTLLHCATVL